MLCYKDSIYKAPQADVTQFRWVIVVWVPLLKGRLLAVETQIERLGCLYNPSLPGSPFNHMHSDERRHLAGGSLVKGRQEIFLVDLQLRRARLCSNVGLLASSNAYGVRITTRYLRVKCWKASVIAYACIVRAYTWRRYLRYETEVLEGVEVLQTISHRLILSCFVFENFTSTLSLFSPRLAFLFIFSCAIFRATPLKSLSSDLRCYATLP